jgi:hypothetical protein
LGCRRFAEPCDHRILRHQGNVQRTLLESSRFLVRSIVFLCDTRKKETYFNASTYHSTYDDMRNDDVIIPYGCIIATCIKVVMKTPLTVVLCIVCNIGTSTLCAYCIPPHG